MRIGLRYERHALGTLGARYGPQLVPSPWLRYRERGAPWWRYAQPDGLLIDLRAGTICILEVKVRHTVAAHTQLRRLYEPLIRRIFSAPSWRFSCCEVVRSFDGRMPFPERYVLTDAPHTLRPGAFGLMLLR